jgi:GntR family transcriptional regulator, transcriptional repressor for pyruvate dehydrogenase complex
LKDAAIMRENYRDRCDIVAALEMQQVTAVRSLMQSHVRRFNRYMSNRPPAGAAADNQGGTP